MSPEPFSLLFFGCVFMVFFLLLALIGLVFRPSPKKPAHQGGTRKGSLEGAACICPLMKAGW